MTAFVQYQNIFTRIQVRPPEPYPGVALPPDDVPREGKPTFVHLFGMFGDAQVGPIYLGIMGILSIAFGSLAFLIIGLNMLSSVQWDIIQFVRQLFWLALEPPPAKYWPAFSE